MEKYLTLIKQRNQKYTILAIILKGGNIISIGYNNYNRLQYSHKKFNKYNEYNNLHAELSAIRKCPKSSLKGRTIIIIGITKAGNQVMSKPCEACMNAIKEVGIKRIVYFDKDEKKYTEKVK